MASITIVAASGGGQQQQQCQPETLSPQELREWVIRRGHPGGGGYGSGGTRGHPGGGGYGAGGTRQQRQHRQQETLSASEPSDIGSACVDALHTFTLNSSAPRCFFRDCTIVTPLTAPVPVSLADPYGDLVVVRASTALPCPAAHSGSLTGFHLPSFYKNLVSTAVS
ncbi:unnamed protein product [Closterium sp. NIES-54]